MTRQGSRSVRRDHILQSDADDIRGPLVEVARDPFRGRAPDDGRHGVDHLLKLLLAPPQRLFSVHLIVDVVTEAVPLDDVSVLIPHRLRAARHPAIDAVGAAQAISQREALAGERGNG